MKQLQPDLWQSTIHRAGILNTHAYFLARPTGNILFYNTGNEADLQEMAERGGVAYQLLTHRDEAGPSQARISDRFGCKLGCSAIEAPFVGVHGEPDLLFGPGDDRIEDVAIIRTPGHTDGSICFFYESPYGRSYLFSGDTIFQWDGEWSTLVLPGFGGSAADLARSLTKLKEISPDLVMSSGFVGEVACREVAPDEWPAVLDDRVAALRPRS
ncbi:MAG: MBL fold metallo-hydrolase [Acidobacteriota bacterium]|nr:MBL fold metallo-hydrolase [Acidobacteriota bacterium]